MVKLAVRESTIQYAAQKNKARENKLLALEKKLKELEAQLQTHSIFTDVENQILLEKK